MTSGNAGTALRGFYITLLAVVPGFLASCGGTFGGLTPAWQQDPDLSHHNTPSRPAQTSTTPHLVERIIYAAPENLRQMLERQGDVVDSQRGLARMGDGTIDLGVQDVATGRWIESHLCGGRLFVSGLPQQAYRIVIKNRTPLPLEIGLGVDGKDVQSGGTASLRRSGLRIEPRGTLRVEQSGRGPLLFQKVAGHAALFDMSPQGGAGLIQVAVYLAGDAPSVGPEKLRPSQVAPLGLLPIGAPEQYR